MPSPSSGHVEQGRPHLGSSRRSPIEPSGSRISQRDDGRAQLRQATTKATTAIAAMAGTSPGATLSHPVALRHPRLARVARLRPTVPRLEWLTALCLLEPTIGIAWQSAFAQAAGTECLPRHGVLLFAGLWLGYAGDRWLDARALGHRAHVTLRHSWPASHPAAVRNTWVGVFATATLFALATCSPGDWLISALTALSAGTYLAIVHRTRLNQTASSSPTWLSAWVRSSGVLTRELWVAAVFVGGATAFAWRGVGFTVQAAGAASGLAALALLNLLATSLVDRNSDSEQGVQSLPCRSGVNGRQLVVGALALAGVALAVGAAGSQSVRGLWSGIAGAALATACLTASAHFRPAERNHTLLDLALLLVFPWV